VLGQFVGNTGATRREKLFHKLPHPRDIPRREVASADYPRGLTLRPSAIHSGSTLNQLRNRRKRKVSLSCEALSFVPAGLSHWGRVDSTPPAPQQQKAPPKPKSSERPSRRAFQLSSEATRGGAPGTRPINSVGRIRPGEPLDVPEQRPTRLAGDRLALPSGCPQDGREEHSIAFTQTVPAVASVFLGPCCGAGKDLAMESGNAGRNCRNWSPQQPLDTGSSSRRRDRC